MSTIFVIPARGGSKGLPGKNLRPLDGIPLVGRSIRVALSAAAEIGAQFRIVCSTDDEAIAAVAREWGAETPFLRPASLASDTTPSIDVVLHALVALAPARFESIVLLQPTSPLTSCDDVVGAIRLHGETKAPVVSVCRAEHPVEWMLRIEADGSLNRISDELSPSRRQDARPVFRLNGAIYISKPDQLRRYRTFLVPETRAYEMPVERSIDIDTELDLETASALAKPRGKLSVGTANSIIVGGKAVGKGKACFIIAEAGVNHDGELELAKRLVELAADAGADAVKFQTFKADRLATPDASKASYQRSMTTPGESQLEMLRRLELSETAHRELFVHCREAGIAFLSSPFDEASADFLEELGVSAFKIPSGEITNLPLLAHIARKGLPLIVSTGMSSIHEVDEALACIYRAGARDVVLMHCVSSYPAPVAEVNLRAMATMAAAFGVPVGYSDHTPGEAVPLAAAALGAVVIEKHFTLDRTLPGPDQRTSLEPTELRAMIAGIRNVEAAMGHGRKEPAPSELETTAVVRKSVVAVCPIPAGSVIVREMLGTRRPGTGISPGELETVIGRRTKMEVAADTLLRWEMLE